MATEWNSDLLARARRHAVLAEPARLAVVDLLAAGDAAPSELQRTLGLPSNLLAHHLNLLVEAGVVTRTRSEGDRRRVYLRLARDISPEVASPTVRPAPRVVFVCTHNSARSQLAVALWRRHSPVPATSAGTHPAARVHPRAVRVAARRGVPLRRSRTRHLDQVLAADDLVVAVCDQTHEELPPTPRLHWSIPDPVRIDSAAAFEAAFDDLAHRVSHLAPLVRRPTGSTPR